MEDVSGCFSIPLGCILSGKCCLSYEAGIPISKFGSMYLMNYFYAHFPFACTAMLTVWFADIYENGKEKTWSSSLTRPHIYHITEKTRKGFWWLFIKWVVSTLCVFSVFPSSKGRN